MRYDVSLAFSIFSRWRFLPVNILLRTGGFKLSHNCRHSCLKRLKLDTDISMDLRNEIANRGENRREVRNIQQNINYDADSEDDDDDEDNENNNIDVNEYDDESEDEDEPEAEDQNVYDDGEEVEDEEYLEAEDEDEDLANEEVERGIVIEVEEDEILQEVEQRQQDQQQQQGQVNNDDNDDDDDVHDDNNDDEDDIDLQTDEEVERDNRPERTLFQGLRIVGMRAPLRHKENIRAIDHCLIALAQSIKNHYTYESLLNHLKWIKDSFQFINIPTSKKSLWKMLGRNKSNLIYRLYCAACHDKIGKSKIVVKNCTCRKCGPELDRTNVATFIQVKLYSQLRDILRIPNIADKLQYKQSRVKRDMHAIEDVFDGTGYVDLSRRGKFLHNNLNLTLTLWTDGMKLTKSSRATTYPIVFQINELSPHARKKYSETYRFRTSYFTRPRNRLDTQWTK
ncbi:homeobox protein 12-like isoform X2 [Leptopilina heterotoma]|uniref:homeobox protein 12-like isoform X2 n=1 Tax=Leptopilina heterotoma TaxID=63436 RepID=UPI001CA7BF77|nr:homeobox protein 12-like isoform X2 [Leptopilina heterotoma]